tara:strand:- start:3612 stop:3815 length:204 start_codon:yes stop_codon:yes gene_type:complete
LSFLPSLERERERERESAEREYRKKRGPQNRSLVHSKRKGKRTSGRRRRRRRSTFQNAFSIKIFHSG